jgi:hypothetical protein
MWEDVTGQLLSSANRDGPRVISLGKQEPLLVDNTVAELAVDFDIPFVVFFTNESGEEMFVARTGSSTSVKEMLAGAEKWVDPFRVSDWASMGYVRSMDVDGFQSYLDEKFDVSGKVENQLERGYDGEIRVEDLLQIDEDEITCLKPFGPFNPPPRFLLRDAECKVSDDEQWYYIEQNGDRIQTYYDRMDSGDNLEGVGKVWLELGTRERPGDHVSVRVLDTELY